MKIYFVRHGETDWNVRKKLQGQKNIPLNKLGLRQAELTSEGMKDIPFDCIFSSPLQRSYITAQILRRDRPLEIIRDDRLKEIDFGKDNGRIFGKTLDDPHFVRYQRYFNDPAHYRPVKGGESYPHLMARADEFYREQILPLEGKYETILVSSHTTIIRCFILNLTGRPIDMLWRSTFGKNCSAVIFECIDGKTEMICENQLFYSEDDL